jgi:hypothetical protein
MSILQKLTEGIVNRSAQKEGQAILNKWEKTGLLEGLDSDRKKQSMSLLLENQAKELLREASSMAAGDVEGFASVAFPIVRRVFGGLVANELVSVQPMSLPSGLIFFLDFTHNLGRAGNVADGSLYGGNKVGSQITGGVDLSPAPDATNAVGSSGQGGGGFYNLGQGYSSPTGSIQLTDAAATSPVAGAGTVLMHDKDSWESGTDTPLGAAGVQVSALTDAQKKEIRFDPDLLARTGDFVCTYVVRLPTATMNRINKRALTAIHLGDDATVGVLLALTPNSGGSTQIVRRLTRLGFVDVNGNQVAGSETNHITFVAQSTSATDGDYNGVVNQVIYPIDDFFSTGGALGAVVGQDPWGLEGAGNTAGGDQFNGSSVDIIPEIDIKVDSIAVTAMTKKLKAKWSPELGQDLNAYHNLDAEVELTGILSEQIALEIDREILNDLVQGATAGTYYWSRRPGRFIDRGTGADISTFSNESLLGADFTGTVSEWYETLAETINDISAQIHRKTLRGGANFLVVSPEAANLLEFTSGFRANITHDVDKGTVGAVKIGSLSKKWDVYVDPYFLRNVVLIGRNGGSFLESGYVYSPYVPLQVTPTIFGVEDFVPRKGVMTRYAKKMVRPDMYGLVVIKDFLG